MISLSVLVGVGHYLCQIVEIELKSIFQIILFQKFLELLSLSFGKSLSKIHQKFTSFFDWHFVSLFTLGHSSAFCLQCLKCFHDLLLDILFFGSFEQNCYKFSKRNCSLVVWVKSLLHLSKLIFCGAMAQSSDVERKLSSRDGTWIILVEDREQLLIMDKFLLAQIFKRRSFHTIFYIEYYYTLINSSNNVSRSN